jgi:lipoprotein NlpD
MTSSKKGNRHAGRALGLTAGCVAILLAAGCTLTSTRPAPVSDRSQPAPQASAPAPQASAPPAPAARPAAPRTPPADGNYRVQPGDTLTSIAVAYGQDVKDLARWNGIDDPSRIRVGQVLRVVPPTTAAAVVPVAPAGPATTRPLDGAATAPGAATPPAESAPAPGPVASIPEKKPAPAAAPAPASDWIWPASGRVIEKFDEKRNKGIGIAGKEGDPVVASADGQVVYSGSGLRGYGNLVILKHDEHFISAYAHNRQILVKQGQTVKRGQRIAEIGKTETTEPKLHFEIRREGKPVDPLAYLPPR